MNTNMPEIEFEDQRLRHTIASLTSELASCQATLRRSNDELAEMTEERMVAIKALCHIADALLPDSPVESRYAEVAQDAMGACQIIRRMREGRDGLAALMLTLNALACYDKRHSWASLCDEQRTAISQLADSVQQAATACLAAHDAAVKARAKAEGRAEGLREAAGILGAARQMSMYGPPNEHFRWAEAKFLKMAAQGGGPMK